MNRKLCVKVPSAGREVSIFRYPSARLALAAAHALCALGGSRFGDEGALAAITAYPPLNWNWSSVFCAVCNAVSLPSNSILSTRASSLGGLGGIPDDE